jgi:hypothetical protein
MLNIEELEIERLETTFGFKKPNIPLRSLYNTILARMKNANYCCEYFNRYYQKQKVQKALYDAKEPDLIVQGFNYNIFNRYIFRCVFHSLVSNNVSRIDNLEKVMLELFPDELNKYLSDPKSFSFKKLCEDFPNKNITSTFQSIFEDHHSFTKVQRLRDQMAHSTIDNILDNDPMLDEEDDYFVKPDFTLSGKKEIVADFAKSLNELLLKIEEKVFNCLMTYGKDCLNDVRNR